MPVFVDTNRCPCANPCFPSKMCPYDVLHFDFDAPTNPATLDPELCGECRGICTNFCDPHALHFAPTMEELRLAEAELLGTMTAEELNAERKRLKEVKEQAEASKKAAASVTEVTAATFDKEVMHERLPVVIDFWAPWCGPCKAFAPTFAQVAQEYAGRVKFCKVNTDTEQTIAQALRIQSIPTLIVFYGGQVLGAVPGAMSAAQLRSTVEQVLQAVAPQATTQAPPSAAASGSGTLASDSPMPPPERVQRGRKR